MDCLKKVKKQNHQTIVFVENREPGMGVETTALLHSPFMWQSTFRSIYSKKLVHGQVNNYRIKWYINFLPRFNLAHSALKIKPS